MVREHSIDMKGFPPCQLSLREEMEGKQAY